jgi:DNA-binding response OmpR family regulator
MIEAGTVAAEAYQQLLARYEAAQAELDRERAKNAELVTVRGPRWPCLKLAPAEDRVLGALFDHEGIVRRAHLVRLACKAFAHSDDPDNVLRSRITSLRQKLKPIGGRITCVPTHGYLITDKTREALAKIEVRA